MKTMIKKWTFFNVLSSSVGLETVKASSTMKPYAQTYDKYSSNGDIN